MNWFLAWYSLEIFVYKGYVFFFKAKETSSPISHPDVESSDVSSTKQENCEETTSGEEVISSKETTEVPEEQEIDKRDNTTEERNSDDFVHNTNSDDEPDAESTIESDDSPIASETTTGISPETSNTFDEFPTECEIKTDDTEVTLAANDGETGIHDGSNG